MSRSLKGLMAFMILITSLAIFTSTAMAQVDFGFPPNYLFPSFSEKSTMRSTIIKGDILIEDFEYSDSIYSYGWSQISTISIWPPGITPIFDFQKGSWVLDLYRSESTFLLSASYERPQFTYNLFTPSTKGSNSIIDYINLDKYPIISFHYRATGAPKEFEFNVTGLTKSGNDIMLKIILNDLPEDSSQSQQDSPFVKIDKKNTSYSNTLTLISQQSLMVTVYVLDELVDNFWHEVWVDVFRIIKEAVDLYDDIEFKQEWYMGKATQIILSSYNFRIDDIFFRAKSNCSSKLSNPSLFEMGPLNVQIFKPYRFLFIADYEGADITVHDINGHAQECSQITDLMLNPDNFLLVQDPNDPNDPVVKYWTDLGADPDKFGKEADPNLKALFGRDFTVDLNLPIFADPNMRVSGSMAKSLIEQGALGFNAIVSGYCDNRIYCFLTQPFPVYPYDGMPTYLPTYYNAVNVIAALGKPYYPPELVYSLEGALWNAGITIWPNIAMIDYTPYCFENLVMTIEATDGINNDVMRFPISVVQYPTDAKGGSCFNEITIICISRSDTDGDLIYDSFDNCPLLSNMDQADSDEDGIGDLCDNCLGHPNPCQADIDQDGIGDNCDLCPNDTNNDTDGDDICGDVDNCPDIFNPDQADTNGNNIGDACDDTQDKPDNKQGRTNFPYNQYWLQLSNFFGFMPRVFSGYQPNIKTGQFLDNIQIPYLIPFPGNYGIHGYWPAPTDNPILNYSYSLGLSRNGFLSPLKDSYKEDSFMYPIWMFPVTESHLQYYY